MDAAKQAISDAYAEQITGLYKNLSKNIIAANGDTKAIEAAENKFRSGFAHARNVRSRALTLISL